MLLEESVCYDQCVLLEKLLLPFALLHSVLHGQICLLLQVFPDLHTGFSRDRSGDLVFPSLSEFSTVYCDPCSQRFTPVTWSNKQIWKTRQWPQDWKRSVFVPIPKKGNAKECSNYHTVALISHTSKVMLKILQVWLQ